MTGYPAAFAAAGSGLPVGSEIGATRFVIDQTEPASLARSRYLVGTFCLLPPMLMSVRVRIEGRDFLPICLLGITQFGILTALLNFGLQYIGSAPAALIFSTFPLMTMVLAALLGYEALTLLKSAGVGLTIVGVAFALTEKLTLLEESPSWTGEAAVFASALCGAVRSVFYRPCLREYPALQVGAMAMIAGHDRLLAFSGHTGGIRGVFRIDAKIYSGRVVRRAVHRRQQRCGILSPALGASALHPRSPFSWPSVPFPQRFSEAFSSWRRFLPVSSWGWPVWPWD